MNHKSPPLLLETHPGRTTHLEADEFVVGADFGERAVAPAMAGLLGIYFALSPPGAIPLFGYAPVGLNTFLYSLYVSNPTAFNDITIGNIDTIASGPFGPPVTGAYYPAGIAYDFATGLGTVNGNVLFNAIVALTCVAKDTQILMDDGSVKSIQEIQRGDQVAADVTLTKKYKVARLLKQIVTGETQIDIVKFAPHSLDNHQPDRELIITGNHPLLYKDARRPAKCFVKVNGVEDCQKVAAKMVLEEEDGVYVLYDLQFETEGSFVANGVVVQSRSPYSQLTPLSKDLYFDDQLYHEERTWDSFDHDLPLVHEPF